jgi:methyl-accepting chemotaxis protein
MGNSMNIKITTKILLGYVVAFVLFLAFAILTFTNGRRIELTTIDLSQNKLPSLVVISEIKGGLQQQTNYLYELYATNDHVLFNNKNLPNLASINENIKKLEHLSLYKGHSEALELMLKKQTSIANNFVQVMSQSEVDWDNARSVLSEFSKATVKTESYLNSLVQEVSKETLKTANKSVNLTLELKSSALILVIVEFLIIIAMLYFTLAYVVRPLKNLTNSINDLSVRKDLKHRLKRLSNDEIGDIAIATNKLIEELQSLAIALHRISGEVSSTSTNLAKIRDSAKKSMMETNSRLLETSKDLMQEIQKATNLNRSLNADEMRIYSAQINFIQNHMFEINEGKQNTEKNISNLEVESDKLNRLLDSMFEQIRRLHY